MRRELSDFLFFEDIGELGIFKRDMSGSSGDGRYGFGGSVVGFRVEVEIEVNRSGEGFLIHLKERHHLEERSAGLSFQRSVIF